jgi:hypothetical protein
MTRAQLSALRRRLCAALQPVFHAHLTCGDDGLDDYQSHMLARTYIGTNPKPSDEIIEGVSLTFAWRHEQRITRSKRFCRIATWWR